MARRGLGVGGGGRESVKNLPTSRNDSLAVGLGGCQMESAPTSRITTRWKAGGGRRLGASRKGHQQVAMTRWWLYGSGARWKVHQRVYNDSLVLEVAGRVSKTSQRVAMTRWQLCGSGAKRKTRQRVIKRLVGARKGREVAREWVCGCVGRVPKGKCTNESFNDSLV